MRISAIDRFRGLSIALMIFFTMGMGLSGPNALFDHNEPDSIHIGDFVLPMFLFASGMSLVFFADKRKEKGGNALFLDSMERAGKLFFVWIFIAPLATGEWFGLDEIMLNILLSIPALMFVFFPQAFSALASAAVAGFYLILNANGMLPDFSAHYLGGYSGALFYLPVMLGGVIFGKILLEAQKNKKSEAKSERALLLFFIASLAVSLILIFLVPPYKMSLSPSFMALSISLSLAVYIICTKFESTHLEQMGKNPLAYWVLMFVLYLVPLGSYELFSGSLINLDWRIALALSAVSLLPICLVVRTIDWVANSFRPYFNALRQ